MPTLTDLDRDLTFDPATHTYRWQGTPVDSVTQLLKLGGWTKSYEGVPQRIMDAAADRGTSVHDLCCRLNRGEDIEALLTRKVVNHIAAFSRFKAASEYVSIASEVRLAHPVYRYAGTGDDIGWFQSERSMLDYKSDYAMHPSVWIQLLLYREAWNYWHPTEKVEATYALVLRKNATYDLRRNPHDADGWPFAVSALWRARWERLHQSRRRA